MNYITYQFETCKLTLIFFVPLRAQFIFNTILIVTYQWFKVKVKRVP
jgi:hypothetical protein